MRYKPGHSFHEEYVYNRANIDASPIIWAREPDSPANAGPLLEYYKDRSIWLFSPDESDGLKPYPRPATD